jgi:hypothetical protein
MPGLTGLAGLIGLSGLVGGYPEKVLSYNPIAYWPLWETVGGTAVDLVNSPAQDGAYTGVTLGQTVTDANGVSFLCPLFDGANDFVNIWTPTFRDAFNGSEGTAMIWARVFNIGVWTDGIERKTLRLRVDATNEIHVFHRMAVNNRLQSKYEAAGVIELENSDGHVELNWLPLAITWSAITDEVRHYIAGSQEGLTDVGLGVWAGLLDNTRTVIGAFNTGPGQVWYGWLAHCAVWDTPLTDSQIADLAAV